MGNKKNKSFFAQQMWRYGYFADQIPPCFSSNSFADNYQALETLLGKRYPTSPVTLSIYKSEVARRIISVPNPYAFACTVKKMNEERKRIVGYAKSNNSESPITFIRTYNGENEKVINSGIARQKLHARSDYIANLRKRVVTAMGFRYRLSLDISNFYGSLYTHALTWAICGKDDAKKMLAGQIAKTSKYHFADQLDNLIRSQNNKESNGILTGPFTSRIYSEIVMAAVDKELRKRGYIFKRYVDDFKFYFRSNYEAQRAIIDTAKVFAEFNLTINQSKIEIAEYPFDLESRMKSRLDNAFLTAGVYGALIEASRLHLEGEKGAYKYALRMMQNRDIPNEDREAVLSILFNINLVDPKYGQYIVPFLKDSQDQFGKDRLSNLLAGELKKSLEDRYEQEILNIAFFQRTLGTTIAGDNLLGALNIDNDFIRIIALDIWANHRDKVRIEANCGTIISEYVMNLEREMQGQSMDGEHWLLLYESAMHGLLNIAINNGKTASFFEEMNRLGISFYCP